MASHEDEVGSIVLNPILGQPAACFGDADIFIQSLNNDHTESSKGFAIGILLSATSEIIDLVGCKTHNSVFETFMRLHFLRSTDLEDNTYLP